MEALNLPFIYCKKVLKPIKSHVKKPNNTFESAGLMLKKFPTFSTKCINT